MELHNVSRPEHVERLWFLTISWFLKLWHYEWVRKEVIIFLQFPLIYPFQPVDKSNSFT
jgi:hypothetical protein